MPTTPRPAEARAPDPRAPFCRPEVARRLVHRLELAAGAAVLEWGVAHGSVADVLVREHGLDVTVLDGSASALGSATGALSGSVEAVCAEAPPPGQRFDLVLLHGREALGERPAEAVRPWLLPEGRVSFVRPVRVPLRPPPPPERLAAWEQLWGTPLRTPQAWLETLAPAGFEPDFAETLGLEALEALYAGAPAALEDEAALARGSAACVSFGLFVARRREPDEKPRPSRDRG